MIIDCHSHLMDPRLAQYMATEPNPNGFNVSWLLEQQDQAGVDVTILNHPAVIERTFMKSPA